jgi:hypothetical protein
VRHVINILLVILLIPLFFIQINEQHDVGDDYAQYLDQSRDFLEKDHGKEVMNLKDVGPKFRSPFFSLTQVPLIAIDEFSPTNHFYLQSAFIFIFAIALYILFLSWKMDVWSAILLTLITVYNGQFILLKGEIAPEFLFMLCSLLAILFYEKKNFLFCAIFLGFAIATRSIALTLFLGVIGHYACIKGKTLMPFIILTCIPLIIWQGLNYFMFGSTSISDVLWFESASSEQNIIVSIWDNFWFYKRTLSNFFPFDNTFLSTFLNTLLLVAFLFGIGIRLNRKIRLPEIFFFIYFITLLLYPYQKAGERFLLPLFPFILFYIYTSINWLVQAYKGDRRLIPFSLFFVLIFSSRFTTSATMTNEKLGANTPSFIELQSFIKENSIPSSSILSFKPWMMHYHLRRPAIGINTASTETDFKNCINQYKPDYFLLCRNPAFQDLYKKQAFDWVQGNWDEQYRNKDFILYRVK